MKNIKLIKNSLLAILAVFLLFTACSDSFLDQENPNNPNDKIFWLSESNAESAIASVYSPIRGQVYGPYGADGGYQMQNVRADDTWAILGEDPNIWNVATFSNTPDAGANDFGPLYNSINRANVFLNKIGETPMDAAKKESWICEVKFLRALCYFYLVRDYGQVPLRLVSPSLDINEKYKASSPIEDIWAQIEKDLEDAAKNVNFPPTRTDGRASRGAAIALLGKAYIYQAKYAEGAAQLALLRQSPYAYELVENPADNFSGLTKLNKESVFEVMYKGLGGWKWENEEAESILGCTFPQFLGPEGTGGYFKIMPSEAIIEAFIKEERPAGSDTKFDKRLYASCYFKYSDYGDVLADETWYGGMPFDSIWKASSSKIAKGQPDFPVINGKKGRFLMKKFTNFFLDYANANSESNPANQDNNVRLMRFAEVLLLQAEACIKTGDLATATANLNLIRERAGLAQKTWSGVDELWDEMVHQKFLELYFENQRWYDLKRWYSIDKVREILVNNNKQGASNLQAKHVYLPIPQKELNTNLELEQNSAWK